MWDSKQKKKDQAPPVKAGDGGPPPQDLKLPDVGDLIEKGKEALAKSDEATKKAEEAAAKVKDAPVTKPYNVYDAWKNCTWC